MKAESSTIKTRNFLIAAGAIAGLRHGYNRTRCLRSYKLFDRSEQLIFLHGLGQKCGGAFFYGAIAMLGAGARGDDHHRDAAGGGALPQLNHQFVAGHTRHFQVGDNQVAAVLRDEFGGFQAVGGELHAIAVLFEHAAYELAHADGIVGHDHDALVLDAVNGLSGNRASSDGCRAWSEDARGGGGGLQGTALVWFAGDHTIQVDQENQAAVGSNRGAGKKFYAAQIFAEILDYDFIFAEDFLDDQADLTIANIGDDHAEVAVDGF